jgi:polyhydroxyalkanoate synthesis regulator phasin
MFDLIKKTMLTGVGLAAMTKDKVEELAKELSEKGKLSEKEGKDLVDDLLKKSEQSRKDLDMVTKKDIARLEKKIKNIEKKTTSGNKTDMSQ